MPRDTLQIDDFSIHYHLIFIIMQNTNICWHIVLASKAGVVSSNIDDITFMYM